MTDSVEQSKRPSSRSARVRLPIPAALPLQYFKGVGPARAARLAQIGLLNPEDVLLYFPRQWEDRRFKFSIHQAPLGEKTALQGVIRSAEFATTRSALGIATARLEDATGSIQAVWFKQITPRYDVFASLRKNLQPGRHLFVYGLVEWGAQGRSIRVEDAVWKTGPDAEGAPEDPFHFNRIVPVYSLPAGISERLLRELAGRILATGLHRPAEIAPAAIRKKLGLQPLAWCLQKIHFPGTLLEKEQAG